MAEAGNQRHYEYISITDHSKGLPSVLRFSTRQRFATRGKTWAATAGSLSYCLTTA
jgi:histidinol phosphatase-like PHP family hydrolase